MVSSIVVWVIAAAVAAPAQPEPSITDGEAFARGIAAIRADGNNYDKFKEPVQTGLIGHSFKLTLPATSEIEGQGTAFYDYKDGKLILDVSPSKAWPTLGRPRDGFPVLLVTSNTKTLGSYLGQNAFGATATVTSFKNLGAGIALVNTPKPMLSPMRASIGGNLLEDTDWWVSWDMPPAEAKALAKDTVAVIEGVYTKLPSGAEGFCQSGGVSATIDRPSNYYTEKCFVGANVTRIALINSATGTVLKEWTTATDPVLGPELWGGIRVGMNKYQLKQVYPAITDYGYIEGAKRGVQVGMAKGVVSKVEVRHLGSSGKAVVAMLTSQHGRPASTKCYGDSCYAKWYVNRDVTAYLTLGTGVTYQPATDPPPIGFSD
jgi:hypothetical protein